MTDTEMSLLAIHRAPAVPLNAICEQYLNLNPKSANALAAINELPLPTFRMSESRKSPRMVAVKHLARYIDARANGAAKEWEKSQV